MEGTIEQEEEEKDGEYIEDEGEPRNDRRLRIDEDPNMIGSGIGEEDDDNEDMDEEAFKEALERAKEAAENLRMRSKK